MTTYRSLKEKANGISNQQIIDSLNKLAKKLPQESEEDKIRNRWKLMTPDRILKDVLVWNFERNKDAKKREAVVKLLAGEYYENVYKRICQGNGFPGKSQEGIIKSVKELRKKS